MKWNDLTFWKKLTIAFGTLLALLIVSTGFSVSGLTGTREQSLHTQTINGIHELFAEKALDHYRWLATVDRGLLDDKSNRLDVQTDDHQCKLGQWLYGAARMKTETDIPGLATLLKDMEAPHARLHASAQKIDKILAAKNGSNHAATTEKALGIYRTETLTALETVDGVLKAIAGHLKNESETAANRLNQQSRATINRIVIVSMVALVIGIVFSVFMTRTITTRIRQLSDFSSRLAEGDFTGRLAIDQKDEIGLLANALKKTQADLSRMFGATIDEVVHLSSSSGSLFSVSNQLSEGADDMTGRANTVATAAEEMSSNMNSVAAASEQAATNVNMVATATEEMTATVNDIAANSEKGRSITEKAVSKAESASLKVNELGSAAAEISKVTEVITEISEQTNLLALNATIEAARAGEAGKGFAVVANEIKELAKQTAQATGGIKEKVEGIQTTTSATVSEIEQITQVIRNVNDIVSSIATAVEEQSITTTEIAENVAQASLGIQEVNENVAQSSIVAEEIAKDIARVSRISEEINESSSRVSGDAGHLSSASNRMKAMMQCFRIDEATVTQAQASPTESDIPDLIRWNKGVELGIKAVDNQHKRLLDQINSLNRAIKLKKSREVVVDIFAELVDTTKGHFRDEENLMRQYGHEGLSDHVAQHEQFVDTITHMQGRVETGNTMVTMDLMDVLKDWLIKHIKGADKRYQAIFKSKGVA